MNQIQEIKKHIEDVNEKYLRTAIEIIRDYNTEEKTKKDYKGRQIFELLQNAEDCYSDSCKYISVKFKLEDNLLIVQNSGVPFDARGIISLMNPDASSKHNGTVGCKGLGFRSVLNWAKSIKVYTSDFYVTFSEEKAIEKYSIYKKLCKDDLEELSYIDRIAILNSAEVFDDKTEINKWLDTGYSTSIVLECDKNVVPAISKQLHDLQFEELLFLKHVNKIIIEGSDLNREIESIKEDNKILIQEFNKVSEWKIWTKSGNILQSDNTYKDFELIIAYNEDEEERERIRKEGVLYSYFKTEILMPFPFLIHGTFELTSERNSLEKDSINNEFLLNKLVEFMGEISIELSKNSSTVSYEPLKLMLPTKDLYVLDSNYNFKEKLENIVKNIEIFPTINNTYIGIKDNPKYSSHRFDKFVASETFCKLLLHCEDDTVLNCLSNNNIGFYNIENFVNLINIDNELYVLENKNADLLELFYEEFDYPQIAPRLLTDMDGNLIKEDVSIFNKPEKCIDLPSWSEMRFLNCDLCKNLKNRWKLDDRLLMARLKIFGGKEYSFSKVLGELIKQSKGDKYKCKELLHWLYNYWRKNNKLDLDDNKINVISRNGEIICADENCYLGGEYDNQVGEKITSCSDKANYVADYKTLGFELCDKEYLKKFFKYIGISEYPVVESKNLVKKEIDDYINYNRKLYSNLCTFEGEKYTHDGLFYNDEKIIKVSQIYEYEKILTTCDFYDLLYWFLSDDIIYNIITSKNETNLNSIMKGYPYRKTSVRIVDHSQMRSWLRKQTLEAKWIPTKSGKKVNCYECTLRSNDLSPIIEVLDIDYDKLTDVFGYPVKKKIEVLFEDLGIAEEFVDLPKEKIYDILLKLSEVDINKTIGKNVYTKINLKFDSSSIDKLVTDNVNYERFKKEGKVLAITGENKEYLPVNKVVYVDKKIYSDDILKNYSLFALDRRKGADKIQKLFCVNTIKDVGTIEVEYIEHCFNSDFQKHYKSRLPYIYAKRLGKDNKGHQLRLLQSNKIILAENVKTKYFVDGKEKEGVLQNYELIYSNKKAYIKIPNTIAVFSDLLGQPDFQSSMAEVLTTMLDVNEDRDAYILIFSYKTLREIDKYFENSGESDLLRLSKLKFKNEIDLKIEFWQIISKLTGKNLDSLMSEYIEFLGDNFNYEKIDELSQIEKLAELFKKIKIDIPQYNELAMEEITCLPLISNRIKDIKNKYRDKYLYYIANKVKEKGETITAFNQMKNDYEFFEPQLKDSIYFDCNKVFEDAFGVELELLNKQNEDYESIVKTLKIDKNFNLNKNDNIDKSEINSYDYVSANNDIFYDTDGSINKIESLPVGVESKRISSHSSSGGVYNHKMDLSKEENGFLAESKVYNTLKKNKDKYPVVEWVSGYSEKAKIKQSGDDSVGYDIRYKDSWGNLHYIEVKSTTGNSVEFVLSKNEFDFAQKHKEAYELWFVFVKDKKPQTPYNLENIFVFDEGEDFFNNKKFTVESNDYRIKYSKN